MTDEDGRIDHQLRAAGAAWRSERPTLEGAFNPAIFATAPARAGMRRRTLASFAGVGALLVVAVVVVVSLPPSNHQIATASGSPPPFASLLPSLPLRTVTPSASSPSRTSSPDATDSSEAPILAEGSLAVPQDRLQSIDVNSVAGNKQIENFVADGNVFLFNEGGDIYVGGTDPDKSVKASRVGSAQPGDQVLSLGYGENQFWTEGHYDQNPGSAPCAVDGALTWSLYVVASNGNTEKLASGVNSEPRSCGAAKPLVASDGFMVALAQEAPRDGHPEAWQITLLNTISSTTLRTITTDEDVTSLGVSGDNVAYTEGTYDADQQPDSDINTRLMISAADHPDPVDVAPDAYDVSFHGDRLAWVNDPAASQQRDSAAAPTLMTATTTDLTPQLLASHVGSPLRPPVSAGDLVAWVDSGDLLVADLGAGTLSRLAGTGQVDQAFIGAGSVNGGYVDDGWLTWLSLKADGSQSVEYIDLTDLFPPAPTPRPTLSPPATPIPPQSVEPPETIAVDGTTWMRFEPPALPDIGGFYDVEQTGGRFLAVAYRCSSRMLLGTTDCARSEVLLASADGLTWTELGTVVTEGDGGAGLFYQDQNEIVAFGSRRDGQTSQEGQWRSVDGGLNWDFVSDPSLTSGPCAGENAAGINQIYSDGSHLIGIGSGIWHSTDGITWDCIASGPPLAATYGHGTFIGVGSKDPSASPEWFWVSDDGINWRKVQDAPFSTDTPLVVADGFVTLAGAEGYGPPNKLLTSSDGQSWTQQPYPFGDAEVELAASDGIRAVVIEDDYSSTGGADEPGAIWVSSSDGVSWTRYQLPRRIGDSADSASILRDRVVVTGLTSTGNTDDDAVLWSAQIP